MTINLETIDDVDAGWVHFPRGDQLIRGYLAVPKGDGPFPAVITAHENLGVTEHRQGVTRDLAREGFVSLTVDLFSRLGGVSPRNYRDNDERRSLAFLAARDDQAVPDLQAGVEFLKSLPHVDPDRIGALGFCLGGGTVMVWGTQTDDLKAIVSLYGIPVLPPEYSPTGEEQSRIPTLGSLRAPIQFHFGADDEAIPHDQIDALEAALPTSATTAEFYRHEGARHAYHDDTHKNYNPQAAAETWNETLEFLRRYLS
ncbi:dienelactone hydrolase family protein [Herbiconiux ginsengi]|uniref:Carboxymethylenebutenolidase n=1 Tax=Herbiconiux ginsengi TaxID=381665 RepID=A0A1H3MR76_9MICO|nr:dienelactone hydrolase family protein [Herbiconiux ginsengi]SDY78994.1 carboxymethylenebutenolidase [Herbiconiux ginsengi]